MDKNVDTTSLTIHDRHAFLDNLDHDMHQPSSHNSHVGPTYEDGKNQAIISPGAIEIADKELTRQQKEDIANAKLLAQLVADKQYKADEAPLDWYNSYITTLSHIGFTYTNIGLVDFTEVGDGMTVEKAILAILAGALSGNAISIVKAGIDALSKVGDNSNAVTIFERNVAPQQIHNVRVSYATRAADGSPVISLGALLYNSNKVSSTFISFFHFALTNLQVKKGFSTLSLNETIYGQVRDKVLTKLGHSANAFLDNINI